jgi:imidazole glycerol-phosphate synthase subunit HisH
MTALGVINYGSGNFRSVCNALNFLNFNFVEVQAPEQLETLTHIILPGVGAFKDCVERLTSLNLYEPLREILEINEKFFLGICVGHQLLSSKGTEFGEIPGLNIIPGETVKIEYCKGLPVPHIGWSEVNHNESALFAGIEQGATFYFVHSYFIDCKNEDHVSSSVDYGQKITASVQKGRVFGVQFHPEKSQSNGLRLLINFLELL